MCRCRCLRNEICLKPQLAHGYNILGETMKTFLSALKETLETLKKPDSIIVLIGIIVALINAYLSIRDESVQQALYALLSILSSLAIAQLISKHSSIKAEKAIQEISEKLSLHERNNIWLQKRQDGTPLEHMASRAKEILIIGRTLSIVLRNKKYFIDRIKKKANIRFVIINPRNEQLINTMAPTLEVSQGATTYLQQDLGASLQLIEDIRRGSRKGLKLRVTNYAPTLSMVVVDPREEAGFIIVELLPYRIDPVLRPQFILKKNKKHHKEWFEYFYGIAENIWENAVEYEETPTGK